MVRIRLDVVNSHRSRQWIRHSLSGGTLWTIHPGEAVSHTRSDRDVHRGGLKPHTLVINGEAIDEIGQLSRSPFQGIDVHPTGPIHAVLCVLLADLFGHRPIRSVMLCEVYLIAGAAHHLGEVYFRRPRLVGGEEADVSSHAVTFRKARGHLPSAKYLRMWCPRADSRRGIFSRSGARGCIVDEQGQGISRSDGVGFQEHCIRARRKWALVHVEVPT